MVIPRLFASLFRPARFATACHADNDLGVGEALEHFAQNRIHVCALPIFALKAGSYLLSLIPPPLPIPVASCNTCAREACEVPMPRDPDDTFTQGDVWGMNESIYTAIHGILVESFPKHSATYKRPNQSLLDLVRVSNVIRDPRPAIAMEDLEDDDGAGVQVCLATRYEGKDISELPCIFGTSPFRSRLTTTCDTAPSAISTRYRSGRRRTPTSLRGRSDPQPPATANGTNRSTASGFVVCSGGMR